MNFHEPRVGTGTAGPGEAVFAIRLDGKPIFLRKNGKPKFEKLFARFSWIPGSEPIHLDLEKLFLLSDSMENLKFDGQIQISEPGKNRTNQNISY